MVPAPPFRPTKRVAFIVVVALAGIALAACGGAQVPSTLHPQGPASDRIAGLWWFMFAIAAAVVVFIGALILLALIRARTASGAIDETPRWAKRLLVGGGVIFPLVVLSVLWVLTLHDMAALSQPARPSALRIQVVGHQWWWEVRYPAQRIVDANDIHIPVGEPVRLTLTTADVNHSFWVPQITAKTDMIAGRVNQMWLQAGHPGIYRGQCAEYCGLQHANMAFYVIALSPSDFRAWERQASQPPSRPTDPSLLRGEQVFVSAPCAACHTIAGTGANGKVGPDLTHFGSRRTIGAGTLPNTAGALGGWIIDAQAIKPGNIMPPIQLDPRDLQSLIRYLEGLR